MGANKNKWISNIYISNRQKQIGAELANLLNVNSWMINKQKILNAVRRNYFNYLFNFKHLIENNK